MKEIQVTPENWSEIKQRIGMVRSILVYISPDETRIIALSGQEERYVMEMESLRELVREGNIPPMLMDHLRDIGLIA